MKTPKMRIDSVIPLLIEKLSELVNYWEFSDYKSYETTAGCI